MNFRSCWPPAATATAAAAPAPVVVNDDDDIVVRSRGLPHVDNSDKNSVGDPIVVDHLGFVIRQRKRRGGS